MAIINYQLKKVMDCEMRDESGKISARWFWLTDSHYYMQLGGVKIFEYNAKAIKEFKLTNPYLDYYFVRLLEDIFEMFEEIIISVPKEVYEYYDTNDKFNKLTCLLDDWYYGIIDSFEYCKDLNIEQCPEPKKENEAVFNLLFNMLWLGSLNVSHLTNGPRCRFIHVENKIYIHYDCVFRNDENFWTATSGVFSIPYQSFIDEIESVTNAFLLDMEKQINEAEILLSEEDYPFNGYPDHYVKTHPEVLQVPRKKGAEMLREEQNERKKFFASKLEKLKQGQSDHQVPEWNEIIKQLRIITDYQG